MITRIIPRFRNVQDMKAQHMNTTESRRHEHRRRLGITGIVAAAAMIGTLLVPQAAHAADPLPDGLTQETAAGSCWEIKQNYPSSANGTYWLVTPALVYPQQFYCDQEREGADGY
ncbi:fibrinogen-like YCDxxxxGGGW domain-containing protein [Microbacterium sp. NIBRBAC000506063]|uniref:fibrinogen-like YCDxxxxGGGW domain-containing protein n=1 Tax=Microbacterium sp. NIBRBAC000506063 TaxID=2734618 RepID=UPI001BB4F934|nr:fibrinogen-like YCDxxxxGGGW domain-containing protein [Microbacterium sp. NIBRBAC000506063]QTV80184.1 hypothetical protein KAE78_03855 [Microbacterium sp. NIBRBAC000506063]